MAEKSVGRIISLNLIDPLIALDFIDLAKKEEYLERIKKNPPLSIKIILSNPGKDIFQLMIRYIILVGDQCNNLSSLLDSSTTNQILTDFKSPTFLKNSKTFPNNEFFFFGFLETYESYVKFIFAFSKDSHVKGPFFQAICEKNAPFLLQVLEDIAHWETTLVTIKPDPTNPNPSLLTHMEPRILTWYHGIYNYFQFQWPEGPKFSKPDAIMLHFRDVSKVFLPTTIVETRWLKPEEQITTKAKRVVPARELIYFDLLTNEIGSSYVFGDKYAVIKLIQQDNLLEIPFIEKDKRRYLDLSDLHKIKLMRGYGNIRIKVIKKEKVQNKLVISYEDIDIPKENLQTKQTNTDINNLQELELWAIKGTGLGKDCFDLTPRFDWKGYKIE